MTTGSRFSEFLKAQLGCRAVWPPVVTPVQIGDFGVMSGAEFHKLGHLSEFGVDPELERGETSSLDVASADVRTTRLAAGAPVRIFGGAGKLAATLALEFASADSFVLKCQQIERTQIRNLGAIARRLGRARTGDGQTWRYLAWRVVWQLYTAREVVCLASRSAGTRVEFHGEAAALQLLEAGKLTADVGFRADRSLALALLGQTGPVGYGLARFKYIGGGIAFFSGSDADDDDDDDDDNDDAVERLAADDDSDAASEPDPGAGQGAT